MFCKRIGPAAVLFFLFLVSGLALAQECGSVLFVTKGSGWSGNEFYLYGLVAEGACSISKVSVQGLPAAGLSNFSYALVSFDAGEAAGADTCEKLRDSGLPLIYFSPHLNTVCADSLGLTGGSGFVKGLNWTFYDASFYNSSSARIFESDVPLLLPYVSASGDNGGLSVVAGRDPSKAYLALFGGLQKRAFMSFPNHEDLALTEEGKRAFASTVAWLTRPESAPPTALAVFGVFRSGGFVASVLVLSLVVVALAFRDARRKRVRSRLMLVFFVAALLAFPVSAQETVHTASLYVFGDQLSVSGSARAACRVDVSGSDSGNVELHLQADFGSGFVDVPTDDGYPLRAGRGAWADCDVVYDGTYCERSWALTALSPAEVPLRCYSASDDASSVSSSGIISISAEGGNANLTRHLKGYGPVTSPPADNVSSAGNGSEVSIENVTGQSSAPNASVSQGHVGMSPVQPATGKEKKLHSELRSHPSFRMGESPEVDFSLVDNDTGAPEAADSVSVDLVDERGDKAGVSSSITQDNGRYKVRLEKHRQTRPGVYNLTITAVKGGQSFIQGQAISWGLVAVNTKRSIYHPGEAAHLIVAVLDRNGFPVAGADVNLTITSPSGMASTVSTSNGLLKGTEKGIYEGYYGTTVEGTYNISVSASADGVLSSISSYFLAKSYYEFDVLREQPTKIDPTRGPFNAQVRIVSNGPAGPFTVREYLPANFSVSNVLVDGGSHPYAAEIVGDTLLLTFSGVPDGSTIQYTADAPKVWPVLFTAGPIEVDYASGTFVEARPWMIAVDPTVTTYVVLGMAAGTGPEVRILTCPASGACVENTTLDGFGEIGYAVYDLLIEDIDNDGMEEIVYSLGSATPPYELMVARCTINGCVNVTGEFDAPNMASVVYGHGLAFGDADNDGTGELVAGFASGTNEVRVYDCQAGSPATDLSSGTCTVGPSYGFAGGTVGARGVAVGDLANVGTNNVMVATTSTATGGDYEITVLNCNATACVLNTTLSADQGATGVAVYDARIGDMDNDGNMEGVITTTASATALGWLCGTTDNFEVCAFNCTASGCSLHGGSQNTAVTTYSAYLGDVDTNEPRSMRLVTGSASINPNEVRVYNCTGTSCTATSTFDGPNLNYWVSSGDVDADGAVETLTGWASSATAGRYEMRALDCAGTGACTVGGYYDPNIIVYAVESGNITNPPIGLGAFAGPDTVQYLTKGDSADSVVFNCSVNLTKGFSSSVDAALQYSNGGGWLKVNSTTPIWTPNSTIVNFVNQTKFANVANWTVLGNSIGAYSLRCAVNYSADPQNIDDAQYNSTSLSNVLEVGVGNLSLYVNTAPASSLPKGSNASFAATVTCSGGAKGFGCPGQVNLSVRFNYTGVAPDAQVPTADNNNATIVLGSNPFSCPSMMAAGSTCFSNFTLLGVHGSYAGLSNWYDVQAISNDADVAANDTPNSQVSVYTGQLGIALGEPAADFTIEANTTFLLNATVTCSGLVSGAYCGNVSVTGRYNETTALDTLIQDSGTKLTRAPSSPTANPFVCNGLGSPNTCILKLVVNGTVPGNYVIDANYSTSDAEVSTPSGNTLDRYLTVNKTKDLILPTIVLLSPENRTYNKTTLSLNFTASDAGGISTCKYELNGVNSTLATCQNTSFAAVERNNTLRVWANDTSNNWNATARLSFSVDTIPPSIAVQSPLNRTYNSTSVPLNFTVGDFGGVSACKYELDGTGNTTLDGCANATLSGLAQGGHSVKVWANDSVDNWNATIPVSFSVDTVSPVVDLLLPANVTYSSATVPLDYTAGDVGGLSQCKYELDGVSNTTIGGCANATIPGLSQGGHKVKVWANDSAENWGVSSAVSFSVDTTFPSVAINSPLNQSWQRGIMPVNYTAADSGSLDACSWRWKNSTGAWSAYAGVACGTALSFNFNTVNCGDNSTANCVVEVRGNDTANNANSTELYLKVDNTAPAIDVASPSAGWYNGTVLVRIAVNDSASGASSVIFYNGSAWASAVLESGNTNTGIWNGTIATAAYSDGSSLTIYSNATDALGNSGSDASVPAVQVDNNPPSLLTPALNVSSPTNKNTNIFVNSTFNDNGGQGLSGNTCVLYVTGATSAGPYTITNAAGASGAVNGTITDTLSDGTNNVFLNCTDLQGWAGSNYTSLLVDTQPPSVGIQSPAATTYASTGVDLNYTAGDPSGLSQCKYELDGGLNQSLSGCGNSTLSGLAQGGHSVKVWANDSADNWGVAARSFTVDTLGPVIDVQSPVAQSYASASVSLNYTAGDVSGVSACKYELDGGNQSLSGCGNTTMSGLGQGAHSVKVWANDSLDNWNASALVSFTVDTLGPRVDVQVPVGGVSYASTSVGLNYTVGDPSGISVCKYELDGGLNQSLSGCGNSTLSGLGQGGHTVKVWANDTLNNWNVSSVVSFTVDSVGPMIEVQVPVGGTTYTSTLVALNYTVGDPSGISVCKYELDGGANQSLSGCGNATMPGLGQGPHSVKVWANDTLGNWNASAAVSFTVDSIGPGISVQAPSNGASYASASVDLNYTVSDPSGVSSCKYELNGGNTTLSACQNLTLAAAEGSNTLRVWANDTIGNWNSTAGMSFTVDTILPTVNIQIPVNTTYSAFSLTLNFTAYDASGISSCRYELTNSSGSFNVSLPSCQNATLGGATEGPNAVKVWANDTVNNWNSSSTVSFAVDTLGPLVNVLVPVGGVTYASTNVGLNFTAGDVSGVSQCKYELDGANSSLGACGNTTLSGLGQGSHSVKVWANDTLGNWNVSALVSFGVDSIGPTVSILAPGNSTYGSSLLSLNYTVGDVSGVSSCRYELDGGNQSLSGCGNSSLSGLSDGGHKVKVWANDTLNNWGVSSAVSFSVDTSAPSWAQVPSDQVVEYGSYFAYDLNATDASGIDRYRINDTANFVIGAAGGLLENATFLAVRAYPLNVTVNDTLGNANSTLFTVTVQDTTAPSVADQGSNVTTLNIGDYFCINATASDLSGVSSIRAEVWNTTRWVNYTMSNSSGVCNAGGSVYSVPINATVEGGWNYSKVFANDTWGNPQAFDFEDVQVSVTSFVGTVSVNITGPANNSDHNLTYSFVVSMNASCSVGNCGSTNITLQYCSGADCTDWAGVSATTPINTSGPAKQLCSANLLKNQACSVSWNVSGIAGGTYALSGLSGSVDAPPANSFNPGTVYVNALNVTLSQPSRDSIANPDGNFTFGGTVGCLGRFCGQVSVYAQYNESGSWANAGSGNITLSSNPFNCGYLNYTNPVCDFAWNVSGKPKAYSFRAYANDSAAVLRNFSDALQITVAGQSSVNLTAPAFESSVYLGGQMWVNSTVFANNWTVYGCNAMLYNQTGLDVVSGALTQPLGNISAGSYAGANWQLNGTALGEYNLTVNVTCAYGLNSSALVSRIEVTPASVNVTDYAYAERVVIGGEDWLRQSSDSGLNWWRNGMDEYVSFNSSSATSPYFASRWYLIANVSGAIYTFDFSNISWGVKKVGMSGNSTYLQYVGETGYPRIRLNYTQYVNGTAEISVINATLQNLEPFTIDGISLKWMFFNFSIGGDSGDDLLVFTNSTGQQESYPMSSPTSFSFGMSRFGQASTTFRDPGSNVYGKVVWERNMSVQGGKSAFSGFTYAAGGNFELNLTFDFGSFAPGAVKGFDPGSGLEQPGLVERVATLSAMDAGESPPPTYTDVTAIETDNSLATTSDIRKVSSGVNVFKIKMLNDSLAYSWIFLQMNVTAMDQTPYQTRVYAYTSDNSTVYSAPVLYNVSATGSVNVDVTNITHQQDGFGYLLLRLSPDTNYVTINNRKLTIAEVRFNVTANDPPVAYWGSPPNGTWYARSSAAVTVTCAASDDLLVRNLTFQQSSNGVSYANVSTDTDFTDGLWNWTYAPSLDSGPCNSTAIGTTGVCYLGCFAKDGNGAGSAVNYSTVRIDGDGPSVTAGVTGVSEPAGWLSGTRTVTCSASDSGSGVNSTRYSYEYTLNDGGAVGWSPISGCTSDSCSWDAASLNDANVWVRCNSTDNVSNMGADAANYAGIDNTLPNAQLQSPGNLTYSTALIPINFTYGDSLSGASSCRYELTNSSGSFNASLPNCQNSTLSGVTSGANKVKVWVNDSVNLWNASASISFTVDSGAPTVTINSPVNKSWAAGTVPMNYTATDSGALDSCAWRWKNATGVWSGYSGITCGTYLAFNFDAANCADNSTANCVVEVRANDTANNIGSVEAYLKVDNSAPIVDVTQPASGWFNGTVVARMVVNDSTSGAASVVFYNGSAWASAALESGSSNNGIWSGSILTTAYADGTSITVYSNATDLLGNKGSDASVPTIQVDNNPPAILVPTFNVSSPTNKNTNIFVNSTFNDNGGQGIAQNTCLLYVTGNTSVAPYSIANSAGTVGAVNGTITATLNDGTNYVYLNCTDLQGWAGSNYATLVVDTQGPISVLDRPANGTNITSTSYLLNASISGLNPASWVMFEYNGGSGWSSACNDTDGAQPYSCSWDVSALPEAANYQVRVRANDTLGNLGAYDVHRNVTIDHTPPSAVFDSPLSGTIVTSSPILLNASSSSDNLVVYSVSFYYSLAGQNSWALIGSNATGRAYSWSGGFPADGTYDLNVTVNDTVGLQNSTKNTNVILNLVNDAPSCLVLYPNASGIVVNGTITVNASANDTDVGDYVNNVTFEYSPNGGGSWSVIGTNTTSNRTYYALSWDTRGGDDSSQYLIRCTARDTSGASGSDASDNTFTVFNNLVNITQIQDNGPVVVGARIYLKANITSLYGPITEAFVHVRQQGTETYSGYVMTDTGCEDPAGNGVYCNAYYTGGTAATYEYYVNASDGTYRSIRGRDLSGNNVSPSAPATFTTKGGGFSDPLEIRSNFGPYYAGNAVLLVFRSRDMNGLPIVDQNITLTVYYPNGTVLWHANATNGGSGYYFYNNTLANDTPVGNYLINLTMLYDSKVYTDFASFLVQSPAGLTSAQAQQLSGIETMSTTINATTSGVKSLVIESVVRVKAGDPYNATLYYYDAKHALADPAQNISVALYDPNGTAVASANATRVSIGKYRFDYGTTNGTASGGWKLDAVAGDTAATMYFYVVGGPFDVIITGMPDTFVPGVTASVTLLNTGDPKDVTMYWWTEYLNGTKVVTASETFLAQSGYIYRNLTLDHVPTGEFYFKVLLRYSGEEEASALRQFYATTGPSLSMVKVVSPDLILARRVEAVSVNLSVSNVASWNSMRSINITDEVPYDFAAPSPSSVQLWYMNSTSYVQLASGYTVTVSNLDADANVEVQASIPEMSLTNVGQNFGMGDYLFLYYSMNSSQMAPNTTREMNSTVVGLDLNLKGANASTTANVTAANAILVAHKKIFSNPDYPANIYVNITLQALGGTISGIAIADYLPEGTEISYVNVTYLNATGWRELYNETDYLREPPFQATLPDGARVDVFQYNFSIAGPVNWNNNLYENDSIALVYNATIIGGGTWILPTIIGGYDPVYKQHIRTEAYSFHRVPLFDIILELATKMVNAGDSVKGRLKLINMGGPTAQVDVLLNYAIKAMDGTLVTERSKTIAILKEKEEELTLPVPSSAKPGMYTFEALMTYTGREAMSTDVFEVRGNEAPAPEQGNYLAYGIAIAAILALVAVRARRAFSASKGLQLTGPAPPSSGPAADGSASAGQTAHYLPGAGVMAGASPQDASVAGPGPKRPARKKRKPIQR